MFRVATQCERQSSTRGQVFHSLALQRSPRHFWPGKGHRRPNFRRRQRFQCRHLSDVHPQVSGGFRGYVVVDIVPPCSSRNYSGLPYLSRGYRSALCVVATSSNLRQSRWHIIILYVWSRKPTYVAYLLFLSVFGIGALPRLVGVRDKGHHRRLPPFSCCRHPCVVAVVPLRAYLSVQLEIFHPDRRVLFSGVPWPSSSRTPHIDIVVSVVSARLPAIHRHCWVPT